MSMSAVPLVPQIRRWMSHALFPGAAIAGLSVLILMGAYAFEYLAGLKPCALCLEQRVPWAILIGLGYRELSMSATFLPRVKLMVRSFSVDECEQIARTAMGLSDASAIRTLAREKARAKSHEFLVGGALQKSDP